MKQGGFTRTIGPDQSGDGGLAQCQTDLVHGLDAAKTFAD